LQEREVREIILTGPIKAWNSINKETEVGSLFTKIKTLKRLIE
jgi:hypothetical protein